MPLRLRAVRLHLWSLPIPVPPAGRWAVLSPRPRRPAMIGWDELEEARASMASVLSEVDPGPGAGELLCGLQRTLGIDPEALSRWAHTIAVDAANTAIVNGHAEGMADKDIVGQALMMCVEIGVGVGVLVQRERDLEAARES